MQLGKLIARTAVGSIFVGHGTQKLLGWFDGPGIDGTTGMMEQLGLRPGRQNAQAAALTETVGGGLLIAGLFTPAAAAGLTGTMITAIRTVHWKNGPWAANGGYEFNVALIAALLAIVDGGPGDISLDHALGLDEAGAKLALAVLAAGAAGSAIVIAAGRRQPAPDEAVYPTAA